MNRPILSQLLGSEHAPLVFRNAAGRLRDFEVATLWSSSGEAGHHPRSGTVGWDEAVSVTNDARLLEYLTADGGRVPRFPAAGDRPACLFDPRTIRVGLVNAGGPAAGLNVVNDSITKRVHHLAREYAAATGRRAEPVVYGYLRGFEGLAARPGGGPTSKLRLVPARALDDPSSDVPTFVTDDHALDPVTFLKSSRFELRKAANLRAVLDGLRQDRLDCLFVVGGNGSQAAAQRIKDALSGYTGPQGLPLAVVGGPKTMDNDLLFNDTTFGFQSTVDELVEAVRTVHSTVECQDRVGIIQVFGAASGFVAQHAAYCSGEVDYTVLPEVVEKVGLWSLAPSDDEAAAVIQAARFEGIDAALRPTGFSREEVCLAGILVVLQHMRQEVEQRYRKKSHALVVVAEGAKGMFAHGGGGGDLMPYGEMVGGLAQAMKEVAASDVDPGERVKVTSVEPTYLIRDKAPNSYDISLCKFVGKAMADAALAGYTDCLVSRWCGRHVLVPLRLATQLVHSIDPTDYFYRSMASRYSTQLDRPYASHWFPKLRNEHCRRLVDWHVARLRTLVAKRIGAFSEAMEEALRLARTAHQGQTRKHGAPYLLHPLRVAIRLLQQSEEAEPPAAHLVMAALLHDVLEDAGDTVTAEMIGASCGEQTLQLVVELTGPSEGEFPDKPERNRIKAERVRAASADARRIKLIDRIDNLRDSLRLQHAEGVAFRERYVRESRDYYVPLAEELGDEKLATELTETLELAQGPLMKETAALPRCVTAGGVEIDFRRMHLPANLAERLGPLLDFADAQRRQIEAGEIVNVDEGWPVGHYWLRNPELAPNKQIGEAIVEQQRLVREFARGDFARFDKVLWIGIGGSALGPQTVLHGLRRAKPRAEFFFFDNTDPSAFSLILDQVEAAGGLDKTLVVVVSKSGGTKETANGMKVARQAFGKARLSFAEHAVAITVAGSKLHEHAKDWLRRFEIWKWVGGRTSLFSAVGLLAAELQGLDVDQLLDGARQMDEATGGPALEVNPALMLAAAWHHAVEVRGLRNMVVLPYLDRLELLSKYLQQLVMESVGKDGKGITVYGNKGSTDQHAFVQQLREGYADFFVTFLRVLAFDREAAEPDPTAGDYEVEEGRTAGDYLAAFQEGTAQALDEAGRPSLRITIERLDARRLGALVALYERAVGYYAALLGINAYHQPGVEAGKQAAGEILGVQDRLLAALRAASGRPCSVAELADELQVEEALAFDILRRLAFNGRHGLRQRESPGAPPPLAEAQFVLP